MEFATASPVAPGTKASTSRVDAAVPPEVQSWPVSGWNAVVGGEVELALPVDQVLRIGAARAGVDVATSCVVPFATVV